jgi:2-polyprenyl-6-methoxyphenol hydroxylase-like FAD-dependent oxidoreductase
VSRGRVAVVGGSVAGLFAAGALRRHGFEVDVYERSPELTDRGAGVTTHAALHDAVARAGVPLRRGPGVRCEGRVLFGRDGEILARHEMPQWITSWGHIYRSLREAVPDGRYRAGMRLVTIAQDADCVRGSFADGAVFEAEWAVGADGTRSTVRAAVAPGTEERYAGYFSWRGLIDEAQIPPEVLRQLEHRMAFGVAPGGHWLGYLVAGRAERLDPGHRRFNWVWYRSADAAMLREHLTDETGVHHPHGIPHDRIRASMRRRMRDEAERYLSPQIRAVIAATPEPFLQPIYDCVSDRFVRERIALLGDAAATARPHVGMGVSKAAEDAVTFADALRAHCDGERDAVSDWERRRMAWGRALVAWSRQLGAPIGPPPADPEGRAEAARQRRPEVLLSATAASDPRPYLKLE